LKPCYAVDENRSDARVLGGNIYDCSGYRLPTEAEWEYAARAGTTTTHFFGSSMVSASQFVIFGDNRPHDGPAEVASLDPNPWGLFDILGNVDQWVHDRYATYPETSVVNPRGPDDGDDGMIRGGNFVGIDTYDLSSFRRGTFRIQDRAYFIGFRLARTVK
jgi:formylglycine-generating enzyme required for sulfatase activity